MDFETKRLFVDVLAIALSIGAFAFTLWRTRDQAREKELVVLRDRLTMAEAKLQDTPTSVALHELAIAIERLGGDLKATVARLDGLGEVVAFVKEMNTRQEEHLLSEARK